MVYEFDYLDQQFREWPLDKEDSFLSNGIRDKILSLLSKIEKVFYTLRTSKIIEKNYRIRVN